MNYAEIVRLQMRIGTPHDGFWGPKSIAACKAHLRSLMPDINPWPSPDFTSLQAFYGPAGAEYNLVPIAFPYPMYYDGKQVRTTRVHKKCAASLVRILTSIGTSYHGDRGVMEEAEDYGGVFNFRLKRGGSSYSLHAYGAAIDLDADDNTFRQGWPMSADMPIEIMEAFAREGWVSAGAFWGYDAMHFQATK